MLDDTVVVARAEVEVIAAIFIVVLFMVEKMDVDMFGIRLLGKVVLKTSFVVLIIGVVDDEEIDWLM